MATCRSHLGFVASLVMIAAFSFAQPVAAESASTSAAGIIAGTVNFGVGEWQWRAGLYPGSLGCRQCR